MAQRNRDHLRQEFRDGERPSGQDFADLLDSFINLNDDGLAIDDDRNLIWQGLTLGESNLNLAGSLRYQNNQLQYHNGEGWLSVTSGGGAFQQIENSDSVSFSGGNVGIGTRFSESVQPEFKLEVADSVGVDNLGEPIESAQVRLGNIVCGNGSGISSRTQAWIAHRENYNEAEFGFSQDPSGNVRINAPSGHTIRLSQNGGQTRLEIDGDGNIEIQLNLDISGNLRVGGNLRIGSISNLEDVINDLRSRVEALEG